MATENENENAEIEVDINEPEKKVEPEIKIEEAEPKKKETLSAEDGIKKLQNQLRDEKQARMDAEARASANAQKANNLESEVQNSHKSTLDNAIEFAKAARTTTKQKYTAALASGDFEAAGEFQEEMSDLAAKLVNLENGRNALANRPKLSQQPLDTVETFAQQLAPPSAAWVRAHPEFVTDIRKNKKMLAAHSLALADDQVADTPGYFAHIEKTLGIAQEEEVEAEEEATSEAATPVKKRSSSPAAAPVTRNMGSDGKKINVVTLSREEVEAAEMMGMTKEEYARNKSKLMSEGRLGRVN